MPIPIWKLVLRGLRSLVNVPLVGTGGTISARYCYSVFIRHRIIAAHAGLTGIPLKVIELGPGDSLGIGLMALLTGTERYYAIDVVRHTSPVVNLEILDELVTLLRNRTPIPYDGNCAVIRPELDNYAFPENIIDQSTLKETLSPERLRRIKRAILEETPDSPIQYLAPLGEMSSIPGLSIDWVLSQAVMEHVVDPGNTYRECHRCLKPGGIMSHQIDFRSHETAPEWNGHWKYPSWLWKLMRGRHAWFINRMPHSTHIQIQKQAGFDICEEMKQIQLDGIAQNQLAKTFRSMSSSDLKTAGALVVASRN